MNIPAQVSEITERLQSWWSESDVLKRVGVFGGVTVAIIVALIMISALPQDLVDTLFYILQKTVNKCVSVCYDA